MLITLGELMNLATHTVYILNIHHHQAQMRSSAFKGILENVNRVHIVLRIVHRKVAVASSKLHKRCRDILPYKQQSTTLSPSIRLLLAIHIICILT